MNDVIRINAVLFEVPSAVSALLREKDAEIERLKKANKNLSELGNGWIVTGYKNIRAEAITEFALRLKSCEFYEVADRDGMQYIDFCDWVDQIAKELKEEPNGKSDI